MFRARLLRPQVPHHTPHLLALAAVAALVATAPAAHAVVVVAGTGFTQPGTVSGNDLLWVGNGTGTTGAIDVNGGSTPTYGGLFLGWNGANGSGLVDGATTSLTLNTNGQRLSVGHWGTADLTVRNGAKLLADGNAASCNGSCTGNVGVFAGTTSSLLLMGAGTELRVRDSFNLATGGIDTVNGFGTVGGHTSSTVDVEDGALLSSSSVTTGAFNNNRLTETSTAHINIHGAGALWQLNSGSQTNVASRGPNFNLSSSSTNQSFMSIAAGGELRINGSGNIFSSLNMATNGGNAQLTVAGAGSKVQFTGESTSMQVARGAGAQAQVNVNTGGVIQGLYYLVVGRDGGTGSVTVDGAQSQLSLTGTATAAANTTANVAILDVGRAANSTGTLTVNNGGRVEVLATNARSNGPTLNLGRDGGTGTLNIGGAGSVVQLSATSVVAGGGANESRNPSVTVGLLGTGNLNISGGAKLLLQGGAVSTVAASRSTALNIGGNSDATSGGTGTAVVTGLGSEIAITGSDGFLGVGRGASATGTLTVADQATVRGMSVSVGRSSGVGTLYLNAGQMLLTGQQTGNNLAGANLNVGIGGGTGTLSMSNNALLRLDNAAGTVAPSVSVGGSSIFSGGQGTVSMASGSRIEFAGPGGAAGLTVGRDGTGVLNMSASTVDMGSAGSFFIGRNAGGSGVVAMANNSALTAGFVGVGRLRNADLSTDNGGSGTLVVNSGSTVTAQTIEIGSAGYLGGTGTITGNVINYGTINPGNSPGRLAINGNYTAAGGTIVLEVQNNGASGFLVDELVFGPGSVVDLSGAVVAFTFLAGTDPVAFKNSGQFDIDTFLKQADAQGNTAPLGDAAFASVTFRAEASDYHINSFAYNPASGVTNLVSIPSAVPEPGTWLMMFGGLWAVCGWARRHAAV